MSCSGWSILGYHNPILLIYFRLAQPKELMQVLPALTTPQVQTLLRELKSEGKIYKVGSTRAALWYPGPETDAITSGRNG